MNRREVPASWLQNLRIQGKEFLKDLHFFWRAALVLAALIFFLYAGTFLMLAFSQEKVIFRPQISFSEHLPVEGLKHQVMNMNWGGGEAKAMLWEQPNSAGVMIYCYGNASNIKDSYSRVRWLAQNHRMSIFVADYPGYGSTPGEPGQDSIFDLMGQWMARLEMTRELGPKQRILWGHSLGGAVAAQLAKDHGAAGLILENTFNSMTDMGAVVYPYMPLSWLLRHPFATDKTLADWEGPILQFHSPKDGVVPLVLGKKLSSTLKERGPYLWVETGGGHNQGYLEFTNTILKGVDQFSYLLDSPSLSRALRGGRMPLKSDSLLPKASLP